LKKNYGVIIVPEGLIEFIPEVKKLISEINEILSKHVDGDIRDYVTHHLSYESRALFSFLPQSISNQLLLDRDPHGNVQVSKIDTERLLILLLRDELDTRKSDGKYAGQFYAQAHFFGYEGRCAIPTNFDSSYCYSLGMTATALVREGATGYMSCIQNLKDQDPSNWIAAGCPLPTMMHLERRKGKDVPVIKKALVDLDGDMFKSYVAVREKWSYLDCYRSPGPI
jgi:diphosphate--fructose-6-phosphate 1-phosphotransferase